jgi:hypothetical protein
MAWAKILNKGLYSIAAIALSPDATKVVCYTKNEVDTPPRGLEIFVVFEVATGNLIELRYVGSNDLNSNQGFSPLARNLLLSDAGAIYISSVRNASGNLGCPNCRGDLYKFTTGQNKSQTDWYMTNPSNRSTLGLVFGET